MASDVNSITIGGRLTRDAEVRHTGAGKPIVSMRLACSSRAKDEQGNWGDRSNYFDLTYFPNDVERGPVPYLVRGKAIVVEGRLAWREWQTQDGGKRQAVEVIVRELYLQGGGEDRTLGSSSGDGPVDELAPKPAAERRAPAADDDIPF